MFLLLMASVAAQSWLTGCNVDLLINDAEAIVVPQISLRKCEDVYTELNDSFDEEQKIVLEIISSDRFDLSPACKVQGDDA